MDVQRRTEQAGSRVARQAGRITRAQLYAQGIGRGRIESWIKRGILIPRLPGVFAVGYSSLALESRLWETVLYAGPGAMIPRMTAAQWRGYVSFGPAEIHVSTPRNPVCISGTVVHRQRAGLQRDLHKGVPVTTPAQTIIDLAAARPDLLPRALDQMDY